MSRRVVSDGEGNLRISFRFDAGILGVVRALPRRTWNDAEKCWLVPETHVVAVVDALQPEGFDLCEVTRSLYQERGGRLPLGGGRVLPVRVSNQGESEETLERATATRPAGQTTDFTVSRLNAKAAAALRTEFRGRVWLVGEISGFDKVSQKRIANFEIIERDAHGEIVAEVRATLFGREREQVESRLADAGDPFRLQDEIQVRVRGRVELHVQWGSYRFVVDDIDPEYTLGEAARRREEIRRKLREEGILERNLSLPLPVLPLRVGLVTSLDSDAYNDVLRTLQESKLAFRVVAHGARVQGRQTEPSVLNALDYFRACAEDLDVLLICRGGGSQTDLAWFDSEAIARAVAMFPRPVVIGIGHERDISVLDFVARRTKTPTAAASLLVDQVHAASRHLDACLGGILDESQRILEAASAELAHQAARVRPAAVDIIEDSESDLQRAVRRLRREARRELASASRRLVEMASSLRPRSSRRLAREAERVDARSRRLFLLDPQRILERGYAIVRLESGAVLTDPADAPPGTVLRAELKQGVLRARSEGSEEK